MKMKPREFGKEILAQLAKVLACKILILLLEQRPINGLGSRHNRNRRYGKARGTLPVCWLPRPAALIFRLFVKMHIISHRPNQYSNSLPSFINYNMLCQTHPLIIN
ncbi:hypothetical protein [Pontiella desulfatans]|uniref:hypothetical protein n=1 Tax=Pontiella desulfatans TaxID=2750659 RepID=UPI001443C84A|nr:hypothetical protein [Pontiella desulfatans]